jgi:uncharacterized membrane protein
MRAATERRVGPRRAKTTFYFLALTSGVFYALSVACDVLISKGIQNPIAFALSEQWVSFVFTAITILFLSIPTNRRRRRSIGSTLDASFNHITPPPRRIARDIALAGLFGGISTFAYYFITSSSGESSAVIPFSRFSLIFLMIGDLLLIRDRPTIIEVQSILSIMFGVILIGSSGGGINVAMLLVVIFVWGGGSAVGIFFQSRAKRQEIKPHLTIDSLNLRLWQLLMLNVTMSAMMIPFITPSVLESIASGFAISIPWLLLTVIFTFFSLITYLQALGRGKMSVVQGVTSVAVVLGLPIDLAGSIVLPGIFSSPAVDALTWLVKIIGTIFVIAGIIALSLSEMKGYVLVRVNPAGGDILPLLRKIHGVSKASAIAGKWDILVRVDIRSLGSALEKTIERIEDISGVEEVETMLILKEWI